MDKEKIKKMLMDVLETVDYDIAKDYDIETAEEPELVEANMDELVRIVERHMG